ncbi:unnamed protein product [Spirodela intermedia]|uniref:Uncharacterized protein n=1 Tax=Spirodela intermedia TaxID=51605 RepID=A0A7I8JQE2_SPIIN|nr:unnamed protein product [Spirodela intermedia]CAA6672384.1 unnamed protein product [Spirodela intermedia]
MANPNISLILKRLDEVNSQKINLLAEVKPEFDSLQRELRFIKAYMADNKRSWPILAEVMLPQLREAAFEAEDIIDDFNLMLNQKKRGVRRLPGEHPRLVGKRSARRQLGTRIQDSRRRFREIYDQMKDFGRRIVPVGGSASFRSAARGTSELEESALSGGLSVASPQSYPWWNGGIGKTVIAMKIYSSCAVKSDFQCRVWVTVSQKFTLTELLRRILDCYLVVMDDIWEKGPGVLPASPGSRVILTTRIEAVATHAHGQVHRLPFLSEEESWELFCANVFPGGERCPQSWRRWEGDGEKMRGLPLAVLVLGGLVSEREEEVRVGVLRRRLTQELSAERKEIIKNVLGLSYHDLIGDLKICFLYLGLFPEDMEIDATKLVQLWVAEGFIQQTKGLTSEETAKRHLEELANRSVLQVVDRDYMGRVDRFRIHDFSSVSRRMKDGGTSGEVVQACPSENASVYLSSSISLALNLRDQELGDSLLKLLFLKRLRVIDIGGTAIKTSPREIGRMVHLTYLGLRGTRLASLPRNVRGITLPQGVWRMKMLRHLHADRAKPDASCGTLSELQTLHTAFAGAWVEAGLGKLSNLRKLGIGGAKEAHVKALSEAIQRRLKRLNFLHLEGSRVPNVLGLDLKDHKGLHQLILNGPRRKVGGLVAGNLPQNLTAITLIGCRLEQDPLALLEGLPVPEKLHEMACSATGFSKLRELDIDELWGCGGWNWAEGAMGSLVSITIRGGDLGSLVRFTLLSCPLRESLPEGMKGMRALEELIKRAEEDGADWSKVRHIPSVKLSYAPVCN